MGEEYRLTLAGLQALLDALGARGYHILGPRLRDEAIIYDEVTKLADLPAGWTDRQEAGQYRMERRADNALFGYALGPQAWRRFLQPPRHTLWRARRADPAADDFDILPADTAPPKFAFLGVRACELHAISIQDRILRDNAYADASYTARRAEAFFIAVNCGMAGGTCFCASMGTGPTAQTGYDLALTELLDATRHEFLIRAGSARGAALLAILPHTPANEADRAQEAAILADTAQHMGRTLETNGLKERLQANLEDPHWDEIATRCLSCGNCTMVCPTCFCTTLEDHTNLAGTEAVREQRWDSCFTLDFSYIHGDSVRAGIAARYRHWLTHKLANWVDQFGEMGCVGCGRCLTWCPAAIDITAEAAAIGRATHDQEDQHGNA